MFNILKLQENHELKPFQESRQLIDKARAKATFFYLEDRDICNYYVGIPSESKNNFLSQFLLFRGQRYL